MKPGAAPHCSAIARVARANAGSVKSERRRRRVMELCGISLQ
jgi:hypothetical protein